MDGIYVGESRRGRFGEGSHCLFVFGNRLFDRGKG